MSSQELLAKLTKVISLIPPKYVDGLLFLHKKWDGTGVEWIVHGALAEALRTVNAEPASIEIVCDAAGIERLFEAVKDLNPQVIHVEITQLPNANHEGNQYPVYSRSRYFQFSIGDVPVQVYGGLQYRVGDWEWGDVFEVKPEYVSVVGKLTAVTPLSVLFELYRDLGWVEDVERVQRVLQRRSCH
jgi:hypothetical protein